MLRALTYHRVTAVSGDTPLNPRLISATPEVFDLQMQYLARHYRVVSIEEVLEALEQPKRLPKRAVLLTFDDAYVDFLPAWDILKKYRHPATLFVPTAFPAEPAKGFWWDRLFRSFVSTAKLAIEVKPLGILRLDTAECRRTSLRLVQDHIKKIPHAEAMVLVDQVCEDLGQASNGLRCVLDWDDLRRLAKEGVALGAHTRNHPVLTKVTPEEAREEVLGSQQDLKREIGYCFPIFCYPAGAHDDSTVEMLRQEGFKLAFTTCDGFNELGTTDPLRLCRINITPRTSLSIFRIRLLRVGAHLDRWRHRA